MRIVIALVFLTLGLPQAHADPSCLQSFNVKPDRAVSSFAWLPGASPGTPGLMSCTSLELTRQAFFLANEKLIDVTAFSNVQAYEAEVERSLKLLAKAKQELDARLSQDAKLDAIRISYRVLKYEFGKASALIGCVAPEPSASKAFCAIGIAILADVIGAQWAVGRVGMLMLVAGLAIWSTRRVRELA